MQEQYLDASCKFDSRGARKITQQELERKETVYASLEALYAIPLNPYCFYRLRLLLDGTWMLPCRSL